MIVLDIHRVTGNSDLHSCLEDCLREPGLGCSFMLSGNLECKGNLRCTVKHDIYV